MDIKIDQTTKKFVLTNGDFTLTKGLDAVGQFVGQRLLTWLGEWFLDITEGVPYREKIFLKNPSVVEVESVLKLMILESPGIIELKTFSFTFDSALRKAHLDFSAQSQDGEVVFSQDIGA